MVNRRKIIIILDFVEFFESTKQNFQEKSSSNTEKMCYISYAQQLQMGFMHNVNWYVAPHVHTGDMAFHAVVSLWRMFHLYF